MDSLRTMCHDISVCVSILQAAYVHVSPTGREGKDVVRLDGVLIRASSREGVLFPSFAFNHAIETEGLAKTAQALGYQPYGMPLLQVVHK